MWFSKVRDLGPFKLKVKSSMEKYRADTWQTKEPETIAWIDTFKGGTLIDVGANIGVYSLYAASRGIEVVAIEPHPQNYCRLIENILLNKFSQKILTKMTPVGAFEDMIMFHVKHSEVGSSGSQITFAIDEYGQGFKPKETLLSPMTTLDKIIKGVPLSPIHIKIDVDGHEMDVIEGLKSQWHRVQSILIEVNNTKDIECLNGLMKSKGLLPDAAINHMKPHSSERRQGLPVNIVYSRSHG